MSIAQKMTELIAEITGKLADNDSVTFETCDAEHFGWDAEKHHAMHALARHGVPGYSAHRKGPTCAHWNGPTGICGP